eukprot:4850957-Alexandrium_andersonii.AAC.1
MPLVLVGLRAPCLRTRAAPTAIPRPRVTRVAIPRPLMGRRVRRRRPRVASLAMLLAHLGLRT